MKEDTGRRGGTQEVTHLAVVETGLPFGAGDGSPRPVPRSRDPFSSRKHKGPLYVHVLDERMVSVANVRRLVNCLGATARRFTACHKATPVLV